MPGETNAIQAGINKLIEKLKNEKDPSSQQRSQRKKQQKGKVVIIVIIVILTEILMANLKVSCKGRCVNEIT